MSTYDPEFEDVTFTVHCTMRRRWAKQFLGLLKWFQMLGSIGSSREITFYADGDGDFRPKFEAPMWIEPAEPTKEKDYAAFFDAG